MAPSSFWLLLRAVSHSANGYSLPLGEHLMGRDDLVAHFGLENRTVNQPHLRFICDTARCTVADNHSDRGTWHNGVRLVPGVLVALADGDLLRIGEEGGFQTTLEVVDDVRRAARERNRQWWTHWAADTQEAGSPAEPSAMLPALTEGSVFLLQHLPELLRNGSHGFAPRFLALFDHVLLPLRWQAADFDLLLDPASSLAAFLPWLAQWHCIAVDDSWTEPQRRQLLASAPYIYARQGTAAALHRVLEIYTGVVPLIRDGGDLPPRQFEVVLDPCGRSEAELRAVIDAHKPIHVDHYRIIIQNGA